MTHWFRTPTRGSFGPLRVFFGVLLVAIVLTSTDFPRLVYALTESLFQMPNQVLFNRGEDAGLAGHDTGGGMVSVLGTEVKLSKDSIWWSTDFRYKRQITLNNLSSVSIATASAQMVVNTKELVDAGKLQADCDDLRVVYSDITTEHRELTRSYHVASGTDSCATSTVTTLTFPLQESIDTGVSTSKYAVYYGNTSATAPSGTGYDLLRADGTIVQATLVCPFNGTTACINQSGTVTPTTATGAIRYSGGKGALQLDGKDDSFTLTAAGSLGGRSAWTIEFWINASRWGTSGEWIMSLGAGYLHPFNGLRWYLGFQGQGLDPTIYQTGSPTANAWTHFLVSYDGSTVRTFTNGLLVNSAAFSGTPYAGGTTVKFNPTANVVYKLDELRVSNIARHTANFTPADAPFEPDSNTVTLYHFDENGDDPRNIGKAIDSSGNGNHATITGVKYVTGLVGVDNSSSSTGALPASTFASHQGIFIEEGTTNLITNPSFEHSTYNTNWGTNYFNYNNASATFTPNMAKRNSAGPFAAGILSQGGADGGVGASGRDNVSWSAGSQVAGSLYQNYDGNQGSVVFWITPEWNGNDGKNHTFFNYWSDFTLYKRTDGKLVLYDYGDQVLTDLSSWTAGTTYLVTLRWDKSNSLNGINYISVTINDDTPQFFKTTSLVVGGYVTSINNIDAIIEGLTVYRRVIHDGTYGIDVGNGDEILQIYNSGTGKDPTLVTGSWDVVFALPTNASTGALATGTGNAWSHPHASNLLYTSTTNTGGFMMNGTASNDGWTAIDGEWWNANGASGITAAYQSIGASSLANSYINKANPGTADANVGIAPTWDTSSGWIFNGSSQYLTTGIIPTTATTAIVRFSSAGAGQILATTDSATWNRFVLLAINTPNGWGPFYASGNQAWGGYSGVTSGVLAIAGRKGYFNGVEQVTLADFTTNATQGINIGRGGTGTVSPQYYAGNVQAVAIYNETLTQEQVQGVTTAMSALGGNISSLASNEKIFSGGYKVNSYVANQGIYRSFTATSGGDYVLRALGHSDGTCSPQVRITRADGTTEISHLNGTTSSTRTDPDVYIFTWESPAAEANQVQLINTASSGTCYWHQVEVLRNYISNASFESGSGDPWIPTSWSMFSAHPGDSIQETIDIHSGFSAFKYTNAVGNHQMATSETINITTGSHVMFGGFVKTSGYPYSIGVADQNVAQTNFFNNDYVGTLSFSSSSVSWSHYSGIYRQTDPSEESRVGVNISHFTAGQYGIFDDIYQFPMIPVSLTVTPASQANSTETSGLRVDGADTLTQSITGLSVDRGVIKFKFTPRHSLPDAGKFGVSLPWNSIVSIDSDSNNRIFLLQENTTTLLLRGYFNGTLVDARWSGASLSAGTSYSAEIAYANGGVLTLKIDGVQVASQSGVVAFASVPNVAYFGTYSSPSYNSDVVISNFTALTPTENTTAPYYKFGSKSAKLVNAGTVPDEYTIAIDPNSTATHTLSAYVYDGTTGNVGGTVSATVAKLVFGGIVVTPAAYTDMGGGWWRLTYTAATIDNSLLYGVQALAGKTIYVDGVQLEVKLSYHANYWTSFADGSLGTGYSWTGTANNSSSTRSAGALSYATNSNILPSSGALSFWVKTNTSAYTSSNSGKCFFTTSQFITICTNGAYGGNWSPSFDIFNGTTNYRISFGFPSQGVWTHYLGIWENNNIRFYVNGQSQGTPITTATMPSNLSSTFSLGGALSGSSVSDFRIFNAALTADEVTNLYQQGLMSHQSASESDDRYVPLGTYTSPVIDLGANGGWSPTSAFSTTASEQGGSISYFTRTSADNNGWSAWEQVLGNIVASDPRRYLQWKANMVAPASRAETPTISDMSVRYVEDTTPPVNPADLALGFTSAASASATLVSGANHNYPQPKFTWSAADDDPAPGQSSSGVASYHVLFTTNVDATPSANLSDPCYIQTDAESREYIVGTTPASCALTDNTWYLRLQSKDNSGNVAAPVTSFIYKFDGTAPDAPATISSTSIGYSANNSFTFFWPTALDRGANASGITHYQYKTGASEGEFSDWQSSNEPGQTIVTQAGNIQAYRQGQNFFFVRSVDSAGNVSATTTNVAVAPFYYNADAPTAPLNVVISPTTSEQDPAASNVFSVSWDKPASFSGEIAKYYYCVNCTPSASTMTPTSSAETVSRALADVALANQQGKNTLYLVAEDNNVNAETGHGNRNFEAFAQADFYASTIAPGTPSNLTISDASDRDASLWRLTLAWKAPETGGTPARYDIYRSTDGDTFSLIGNTSSTAYTDAGLTQGSEYSYKVRAVDNAGSISLFSNVVQLTPEGKYTDPPAAGGDPSVSAGSTTATITWVTSRTAYGTVEFGKSTAYGSAATETAATTSHLVKLTGLAPGTEYHYRVQALDESALVGYDRTNAYSSDYIFTTLNTPAISKVEASDITLETALVSWSAASLVSAEVEYGETTAYGKSMEVSVGTEEGTHSVKLSGLSHSTTYHFRIRAVDVDGNDLTSDDYSLQTIVFPRITAIVLNTDQTDAGTAAVLAWASNVPTYGTLEYQVARVDPEYARTTDKNVSTSTALQKLTQQELADLPVIPVGESKKTAQTDVGIQHVERVAGLTDGSIYVFIVRGRDQYGNEAVSEPIRYVTGADTRPPQVRNLIFETPISGTGANATAQIIVSWETDEPAVGQIAWGEGSGSEYSSESEKEEAPSTKHVIVLRDLRPTTSYHLKVVSTDRVGNASESEDTVVVTPSAQQAAFDIIIKNLEDVFGFLRL
jgi:hypothetical protein